MLIKFKNIVLILSFIFISVINVGAMPNKDFQDKNRIVVEAEGIGPTKLEALQSAWMEAVRKGVGMFMTAKTEIVNDDITEKIVTHSRGQVNSYEVISETNGVDGWVVKIKANIDKDILEETAQAVQSKSVAFDGTSLAASQSTK